MAIYGIKTEYSFELHKWIDDTRERMKDNNLVKNPFTTKIKEFYNKDSEIYVFEITPIYFNPSPFGLVMVFTLFCFMGLTYWLIPGFVIWGLGIFWSRYFYYILTKLALKKAKHRPKIHFLAYKNIIKEVVLDGTKRDI